MPYKDLEQRKKYHKEYMRRWKIKNKDKWEKIVKKSESRPERIQYLKNWQITSPKFKIIRKRFQMSNKSKTYQREWNKNHPERNKIKGIKYYNSDKGILNVIKKVEVRRKKFKDILKCSDGMDRPLNNLIKLVDNRDKVCVYCQCEFSQDKISNQYRTYDHLNSMKPHSINNTVKCCRSCNSSKADRQVLNWLKDKGYVPSKIILDLLKIKD